MYLLWEILIGIFVGWIAGQIVKGRGFGILVDLLVGIVGALLGGVIVVEQVFGLQGLGQHVVTAITQGDQPVVIGFVILAAVFVVVANLIVDISYAALDPRVRIT